MTTTTDTKKQTTTNTGVTSMFKTVEELKSFISWAHDQKIKVLKVGDVQIEFSEISFIPEDAYQDLTNGGPSTLAETEPLDSKEEEELLYHSAIR